MKYTKLAEYESQTPGTAETFLHQQQAANANSFRSPIIGRPVLHKVPSVFVPEPFALDAVESSDQQAEAQAFFVSTAQSKFFFAGT